MLTSPRVSADAGWYLLRLSRMGPREVVARVGDAIRVRRWRADFADPARAEWLAHRGFAAYTRPERSAVGSAAIARLLATADELLAGRAEHFGVVRHDMADPDWFRDPKTGRRAPSDAYAFDVPYRREDVVGDVKQLWEPSRHQHLTVLAAAYAFTGDDRYAVRVAEQLRSWWAANPPLTGVAWVSGIELGIRLLSWVWTRRLLGDWPGVGALFDDNPVALRQLWYHQHWLASFGSTGSSANNHAVAEAAGLLAAACAFPWFPQSGRWCEAGLAALEKTLRDNTFGSGLNRELATEYHGLVLELGLAAAVEARAAGVDVDDTVWSTLVGMCDALAAVVDATSRPPRQGDADDGHGLLLDGVGTHRWASLLATGRALFGACRWWPPDTASDVRTPALVALAGGAVRTTRPRPSGRLWHLADAGLTVLVSADVGEPEIWCRCDGGPHGLGSLAAHAHADALSIEVRHDGVDVLADPGTYCYHGEPEWRRYFRSTLGHNTLELDGADQSVSGGPFLWTRHAGSRVLAVAEDRWTAAHDGYARGPHPVLHRRSVRLSGTTLRVTDELIGRGRRDARLAFHLGPAVECALDGARAALSWPGATAVLTLPERLTWQAHRAETEPPLGWYSAGFGRRQAATTLVGCGRLGAEDVLVTELRFAAPASAGGRR